MKPLHHVAVLVICLTAIGCKVSKQDAELLERDLRIQEDEIYTLRDCVDTYQQKLAASRSENRALRKELAARGGLNQDFMLPGERGGPGIELGPTQVVPPSGEAAPPAEFDPGQLREAPPFQTPRIAPPDPQLDGASFELMPDEELSPEHLTPGDDSQFQGSSASSDASAALVQFTAPRSRNLLDHIKGPPEVQQIVDPVHDLEVTEITLNRMLTGGMNQDRRHGDEGIMVVVEPRNPKNQIVEAFGDISVVVLDPALEGEAARVARWDITSQELEHRFRNRQFGRGFQLQLPWPGDAPEHSTLHLFVRFVAADGRKLIVDRPLEIEPPGGAKDGGWVPATRSDVVVEEHGPDLIPAPKSSAVGRTEPDSDSIREDRQPTSTAVHTRDALNMQPASPRPDERTAGRTEERLARTPKSEPDADGKKQRPKWTPYR